jgi:hypothetical protein
LLAEALLAEALLAEALLAEALRPWKSGLRAAQQ